MSTTVPSPDASGSTGDPPSFAYTGQTAAGRAITGSIQARTTDEAQANLAELGLRVMTLDKTDPPRRRRGMGIGEFQAFNQQLAHLAEAGFPLEQGLRLVGHELGSGRLASSIHAVANELKSGVDLPEAFALHRRAFPAQYGIVLEAGIKTNNLPGVLMGLGRHLELTRKLVAATWRATVYPAIVFLAMLGVLIFLGISIAPPFNEMFIDFDTELPAFTKLVLNLMQLMPVLAGGLGVAILLLALLALAARTTGQGQRFTALLLPIPLIGPILKRNLVSRWCDGVRLGVSAGLDLPAALDLSAQAIGNPAVDRDTRTMLDALQAGRDIDATLKLRLIPPAVPAAIELTRSADDLPEMLGNLSEMYAGQAEARIHAFQAVIGPAMLIFIGLVIATVVFAMFLPLVTLMQSVM